MYVHMCVVHMYVHMSICSCVCIRTYVVSVCYMFLCMCVSVFMQLCTYIKMEMCDQISSLHCICKAARCVCLLSMSSVFPVGKEKFQHNPHVKRHPKGAHRHKTEWRENRSSFQRQDSFSSQGKTEYTPVCSHIIAHSDLCGPIVLYSTDICCVASSANSPTHLFALLFHVY